MDEQVISSSKALGTQLNQVEQTLKSELEGLDVDFDEVCVNKRPKLSSNNEDEVEKDCMIIDPVLESLEKILAFKIEKIPLVVVLIEQAKLGVEKQPRED
jgi:hypothetical protein